MANQSRSRYPTEFIPDADLVSRCCFTANGVRNLDSATDFKFSPATKPEFPLTLSAVWRKYAVNRYEVDQHGERIAEIKNERGQADKRKAQSAYVGYRTSTAKLIRDIRTEHGFGYSVTHAPSKTSRAHAHISIIHSDHPDGPVPAQTQNDSRELVHEFINVMPMDDAPTDEDIVDASRKLTIKPA